VDDELDDLLSGVSAIVLEGPKAVGKTAATPLQCAHTVHQMDHPAREKIAATDLAQFDRRGLNPDR